MIIRSNRSWRETPATIATVLFVLVALGCSSVSGTKAGKATGPVVLHMAARDVDFAQDPAVDEFVRLVRQRSKGALRIDVSFYWGNGEPYAEQQIVRDVAAGKVDLGAVGTRVMDTLGVRSFQALTAPMLIDSYPLEQTVIASRIPSEMLHELTDRKLTGLAVLGGALRKPVAVKRPLRSPTDWRGIGFAAFRSRAAAAAVRALGARPSDVWGVAQSEALIDGRVEGAENDLGTYLDNSREVQAPYVTVNVNLWPRTEVLLTNRGRFTRLTSKQQGWLRQAAAEAARRSTSMYDHERRLTVVLCNSGAHIVNATPSGLAALRKAFAPVYAAFRQDAQTSAFIAQIDRMKRSIRDSSAPPAPAGCAGTPAATSVASQPAARRSTLNGTYRFTVTDAELKANGFTGAYRISQNHGLFTIVLENGSWRGHQQADNPLLDPNGEGRYALHGDLITFTFARRAKSPEAPPPLTLRWTRSGKTLRFAEAGSYDPIALIWFLHPWTKIS